MAAPNIVPGPRSVPLREARVRFSQLVALTELNNTTTIITRDNDSRPIAVLAPTSAVRDAPEAPVAPPRSADWHATVNAGWAKRLDSVRAQLSDRHARECRVLLDALNRAWAELDRLARPGADRDVDELRALQAELISGSAAPGSRAAMRRAS
ncbi:hypothetical protein Afil01_50180 [Actinorhabdospora filicis]|uniref:Antitoxin n=1 Tax=Actinorhabdospora filicis TaxID=1785913 RepID=A0A9W6WC42_9ACTN|nr:type II toxin-antitoxin system Phd/YefM family antitoxin [Actinorhabdospora filicis]GLZ80211.1 hypothetical protein Afil01_50180 [Actinorhabdospora filicis]